MGNPFGSEYWTFVLPRRVGAERVAAVMESRLPMGAAAARRLGLVERLAQCARELPRRRAGSDRTDGA